MVVYYNIDWEKPFYALYGGVITMPAGAVLWRGYDPRYPAVSDRPAYFGSKHDAESYAGQYYAEPSIFTNKRALNLLDIRFMKVLLAQLFEENSSHLTDSDRESIAAASISFGICSLQHQIKLLKIRFKGALDTIAPRIEELEKHIKSDSLYERPGFRIAETVNDAYVMGFLKGLFGGSYDGFISPPLYTPYHYNRAKSVLNSELIIFNPLESGIGVAAEIPYEKLLTMGINGLIMSSRKYNYITIDKRGMQMTHYMHIRGGGSCCKEDYNALYDDGDKEVVRKYKAGLRNGVAWQKRRECNVVSINPPVTALPVSPW